MGYTEIKSLEGIQFTEENFQTGDFEFCTFRQCDFSGSTFCGFF